MDGLDQVMVMMESTSLEKDEKDEKDEKWKIKYVEERREEIRRCNKLVWAIIGDIDLIDKEQDRRWDEEHANFEDGVGLDGHN